MLSTYKKESQVQVIKDIFAEIIRNIKGRDLETEEFHRLEGGYNIWTLNIQLKKTNEIPVPNETIHQSLKAFFSEKNCSLVPLNGSISIFTLHNQKGTPCVFVKVINFNSQITIEAQVTHPAWEEIYI